MSATLFIFIVSSLPLLGLILYPIFSRVRAWLYPRPVKLNTNYAPPVSILISCYNEERYITERIEALLDPQEWIPGSEILITSTGSTDQTNALLQSYADREEIRLFFEPKITKIEALNSMVPLTKHDILIFSDCRQYMRPGSIKALLSNLHDPEVGTVNCTILDTEQRPSFFRRMYLNLALNDSKSGSTFNLYGALYAQRKSVFRPIPEHLLFDDFFVATSTLAQGKRLVQEENAVLHDIPFTEYYHSERLERLARGLLIFLFRNNGLIKQLPPVTRMRFIIYKYFKLLLPVCLLVQATALCVLCSSYPPFFMGMVITLLILILLLFLPVFRHNICLIFRMQYSFFSAIIGYLFLNRRSKHWEPLTIRRRWFRLE